MRQPNNLGILKKTEYQKTLWNRSRNMCMTEKEYAEFFGYIKVWGLPKKKYEFIK